MARDLRLQRWHTSIITKGIGAVTRDDILAKIASCRVELNQFDVQSLSLFGSVARNEATQNSDIDLLVQFNKPVGLLHFVRLKRYLEDLLGRRVDLVTPDALKRQFRDRILKEAIRAA